MTANAVSLKLPEFWESSASAWFAQTEAQFALRQITADETKYDYVGLGDSKPSELMDRMLDLLGDNKPGFLFLHLFLRQLPAHVRAALANTASTDCRELAAEADSSGPASASGVCYYHGRCGPKAKRCRSPCSFGGVGKRQGQRSLVAVSVGHAGRLLFIRDSISGRRFLCDTGAQRSLLPASQVDVVADTHGPPMEAANGSPIRTYGTRHVELCFGGQRFGWDFVTAKVAVPLLGSDFLCAYGLLVDVKNHRLIDAVTFCSYACALSDSDTVHLSSLLSVTDSFQRLLAEFPALTQPTFSSSTAKHGVEHHIDTTGPPVYARARRLEPNKLAVAKAEFEAMERLGIVRRSNKCGSNPSAAHVLWDLPFLFVHLDDILVASSSPSEHLLHLRTLFERLTEHGLIINPAKCEFGLSTIDFLGHRVTQDGVVPLPSKVEAITTFPRPVTVRALQEFLGMVHFYHRFLPRAAQTMRPLYEALKGGKPKHTVDWSPDRDKAFVDAKAALAKAAMLAHPASSAPVALTTDASDYAVGAVYEQWVGNAWQPLAFFSRQLRPSEWKYSTFNRELLGVYLAIRHFRFLLEGRQFTVFVDHKPLTFAMSKVTQPWSGRQQRQLTYISEFMTDIAHLSGKHNYVADCLSRAVVGAVHLGLDYGRMAAEQATDPDVQACRSSTSGLRLQDVTFDNAGTTLLCDVSMGSPRPVVPAK
ncbi:hypothetical protein SRHO_G00238370 [Serrasalmus rhombeus]